MELRTRLAVLAALATALAALGGAGIGQAATKKTTTIVPASTNITLAPIKVKGYTLTVSASRAAGSSLSLSLVKGPETHSYTFPKNSFALHLSPTLSTGSITAHLGKYGHLHLSFAAAGAVRASAPGKGCKGPKVDTRALRITSSSGSLVLDHSFFRTVHIGRIKATATKAGREKCTFKSTPPPSSSTGSPSLSMTWGKASAVFVKGAHKASVEINVLTSGKPLITHTLDLTAPATSFTIQPDGSSAAVQSFGPHLTGSGSYKEMEYSEDGSTGNFTGTLVAHFDSIAAQKVVSGAAFLDLPGFVPPPTANFAESTGSPGQVNFNDESAASASGASIVGWAWNFGDGSTSSLQNPSHSYTTTGNYYVTLTVTDSRGKQGSATEKIYVIANQPPTASFTWDNSAGGNEVSFMSTSSDPDGSITAWSWNLGDGSTSTDPDPDHTYATSGTYHVTLTVTDDSGATSSQSQDVTATP